MWGSHFCSGAAGEKKKNKGVESFGSPRGKKKKEINHKGHVKRGEKSQMEVEREKRLGRG